MYGLQRSNTCGTAFHATETPTHTPQTEPLPWLRRSKGLATPTSRVARLLDVNPPRLFAIFLPRHLDAPSLQPQDSTLAVIRPGRISPTKLCWGQWPGIGG